MGIDDNLSEQRWNQQVDWMKLPILLREAIYCLCFLK